MVFGAGSPRIWEVVKHTGSPTNARQNLCDPEQQKKIRLTERHLCRIRQVTDNHIDELMERYDKLGISILTYYDSIYPRNLRMITNAPIILYYRGDISLLESRLLLTVVGTHNPTDYSLRVEKHICNQLVQFHFILATGFAVGIDITANLCALAHDKPSIALMGCGLDVAYPPAHHTLKDKIADNGLILSEFSPGTSPHPSNFPARNRILSGLSAGTLVV